MKYKSQIIFILSFTFVVLFSSFIVSCDKENLNNGDIDEDTPTPDPDDPKPGESTVDISKYFIPIGQLKEDTRVLMDCENYGEDVIKAINDSLAVAIKNAKTKREKTVVAAKFIVSFKSVIPYAYETTGDYYKFVARYTRKGLFLSPLDEGGLTHKPWGCEVTTPPAFITRYKNLGPTSRNGLHCSSFVGWCLFNAGVADASLLDKTWADNYKDFPLSTMKNLKEAKELIKEGDLLYFKGHIAIVIDVDGDIVTFAESAIWNSDHTDPRNGSRWRTFNRATINYDTFRFKSLIQMEGAYK